MFAGAFALAPQLQEFLSLIRHRTVSLKLTHLIALSHVELGCSVQDEGMIYVYVYIPIHIYTYIYIHIYIYMEHFGSIQDDSRGSVYGV